MTSFRQFLANVAVLLAMCVICSCTDKQTKMANDVVADDPKVRMNAVSELRHKPDPEVLKKLIAKYEHGKGEAKYRAGHALLEVTDSINKKSKGEEDDDSRWAGVTNQVEANTGKR